MAICTLASSRQLGTQPKLWLGDLPADLTGQHEHGLIADLHPNLRCAIENA